MIQFTLIIQMKKRKKYHTVRIFQKLNRTIVKWGKINTSNTQIQSLLGTGSSVNSGRVISFPRVSKMPTLPFYNPVAKYKIKQPSS